MSTNQMNVVGNLTDEPSLRYTTQSNPVSNLRIAVSHRVQVNNEWVDRPTFLNVVCFGTLAENIAQCVTKGDRVMVAGRLNIREYTPEAGTKSWFTELVADEIGVALRWATVDSIDRTTKQRETVPAGAPADDGPIYGDSEPF